MPGLSACKHNVRSVLTGVGIVLKKTALLLCGFIALAALPASLSAGACTSKATGNWNNGATWSGTGGSCNGTTTIPTAVDSVTINAGHIVTISSMTAISSGTWILGTLKASRVVSSSWTLVKGDINVNSGGYLDYGSEADPLPASVTAYLVLSSGSFAGQYGLIVNNGGNFTVRGASKTPYAYATGSIAATADTNLTVYGSTSVVGWGIGDVITIGPTQGNGVTTTSTRTISSISGGPSYTIGWSNGDLGTARNLSSTSPIIVSNLTRNVVVRSSGTTVAAAGGNSAYIRNLAQNTTSFALTHGEFAYFGSMSNHAIKFDGSLTRGSVSSSTIRDGYYGVYLNGSSNNTLAKNNFYGNSSPI